MNGLIWFLGGTVVGIIVAVVLWWFILQAAFEDLFKRRK